MIEYIGVNDHVTDLFEGQYRIPNGMSYNSYLVVGDSIAVMDTVDGHFVDEWLLRLKEALKGKKPDYLVLLHMEQDHSAGVKKLLERYPETEVVGNSKTFAILKQFFPELNIEHMRIVKENDVLSLGGHELKFIFAPMVHWPEVMMAYETTTHSLFSADAFGKFGALFHDDVGEDHAVFHLSEDRRPLIDQTPFHFRVRTDVLRKAPRIFRIDLERRIHLIEIQRPDIVDQIHVRLPERSDRPHVAPVAVERESVDLAVLFQKVRDDVLAEIVGGIFLTGVVTKRLDQRLETEDVDAHRSLV